MLPRLLTARAAKALAVLLLLSCCVGAYISAGACAALFRGEVAVNLTASGAAMLLNGSPQEGGWLGACALQTGVHKAADEQTAPQCL